MCQRRGFRALALAVIPFFANALPSVPVATDPILVTATVPTVLPSLVTIYSVVPATDAAPNQETIVTTTIDDTATTITSTALIAGSVTSTIISTISFATSQVVVNTVGYSTIFGPDPTTAAAPAISETAISTPATSPSTTPQTSELVSTTSSSEQTTSLAALTTSSSAATPSGSPSSTSTAVGANNPSAASISSSHSKGLSTGAKAGIGVGVALVVILLVVLSFLLGQRYTRRRNNLSSATPDEVSVEEKDVFQAGRPYESTSSQVASPALTTGKTHAYSTNTTAIGSGSPSVSGRSYDMPGSPPAENRYENSELSALPPIIKEDNQMYVGVPTHMSGSKRWSMKEFMK
jgi:cell wall integrity and stress response component